MNNDKSPLLLPRVTKVREFIRYRGDDVRLVRRGRLSGRSSSAFPPRKRKTTQIPFMRRAYSITHKTQNSLYQAQRLAANTTRYDRCVQSFSRLYASPLLLSSMLIDMSRASFGYLTTCPKGYKQFEFDMYLFISDHAIFGILSAFNFLQRYFRHSKIPDIQYGNHSMVSLGNSSHFLIWEHPHHLN